MSSTYTANLNATMTVNGSETVELAANTSKVSLPHSRSFTAGTGSGNINATMTDVNTLAALGSKTYDLDGTLTGQFNEEFAFATVKSVMVKNTGTANPLTISGDFLGLTETITVPAGGCFLLDLGAAGVSVTADTGDGITIASTLGTSYHAVIVGVKA